MHVLHVSSEVHPYSKTGGLADVAGSLSPALVDQGVRVTVVTPFYRSVRARVPALEDPRWPFAVPLGPRLEYGRFFRTRPRPGLEVYFVDHPGFFDRAGIYHENRRDYPDNAARFIFFSKAAAVLGAFLPEPPDLVNCHDWQAGLLPLLLASDGSFPSSARPPGSVMTIHNLAYSGAFPIADWALTNLPSRHLTLRGVEFFGSFSLLKAGLQFADGVTTVSPHYAEEICTVEFGAGLEGVLNLRKPDLVGILNGVDYAEWQTRQNPHLPASYGLDDLAGKAVCKQELQREAGLPVRSDVPLFASVSRIEHQKGSDLVPAALESVMGEDWQFVVLGSGDARLEESFRDLAIRHPDRVAVRIGFDSGLAHRIEAGADFFLMPSRFEPCGLNQMYSQRYGTVPIVRDTGGLHDSVVDPRENPDLATGIKFGAATPEALAHAVRKAIALWWDLPSLNHFRHNGMASDFSWKRSATEYLRVYERLMARRSSPAGNSAPGLESGPPGR